METTFVPLNVLARKTLLPAAWIRREADAGRLPCIRAGRRRMFDVAAVLKALTERREGPVPRD